MTSPTTTRPGKPARPAGWRSYAPAPASALCLVSSRSAEDSHEGQRSLPTLFARAIAASLQT